MKLKQAIKYLLIVLIILFELVAFILQIQRAVSSGFFFVSSLVIATYFTNQSNFLVTVSTVLSLKKLHKKWYEILYLISLINIVITASLFHIFLRSYFSPMELLQMILHTIVPILFMIYFMFYLKESLPLKKVYLAMIYPLIYFASVYLIFNPIFGELISTYYPDSPNMPYIYPFFNPSNFDHGFIGIFTLMILVIMPIALLLSIILMKLKLYINQKIKA